MSERSRRIGGYYNNVSSPKVHLRLLYYNVWAYEMRLGLLQKRFPARGAFALIIGAFERSKCVWAYCDNVLAPKVHLRLSQ